MFPSDANRPPAATCAALGYSSKKMLMSEVGRSALRRCPLLPFRLAPHSHTPVMNARTVTAFSPIT